MTASNTIISTNTHPQKTLKSTSKPAFIGRLQPCTSRLPAKPDVNFAKGGSDFRCPHNTSAFGKQLLSGKHQNSEPRVNFASAPRFIKSDTIGVGPCALGQSSSMKRQVLSHRRSAESVGFGTSSRDGALKMYTVATCKR